MFYIKVIQKINENLEKTENLFSKSQKFFRDKRKEERKEKKEG